LKPEEETYLTGWRLSQAPYDSKAQAFDGEGAFRTGRRWNSRGVRVVYAASSIALASLEILVNLEDMETLKTHYTAYKIRFPQRIMQTVMPNGDLNGLPDDWSSNPKPPSAKAVGDAWVKAAQSAVLEIPSAIIPLERNYLINPLHPDFKQIEIESGIKYAFDPRLIHSLN
jgi:RES domain-containing protein